jgi:hypothetical protein
MVENYRILCDPDNPQFAGFLMAAVGLNAHWYPAIAGD